MLPNQPNILDTNVSDIDGNLINLRTYENYVLLIVNTASHCGFTDQYRDLELLYQKYKGHKYKENRFEILAFPSNDFANQEPNNEEQIKQFCLTKYQISFPLFAKIKVKNGKNQSELYQKLAKAKGSVIWNFQKYIIAKNGNVIKKFAPWINPNSKEISFIIEKELLDH